MAKHAAVRESPSTLGVATLLGVALMLVLMGFDVMSDPARLVPGVVSKAIACAGILVLYGVAAIWARSRPADASRTALNRGATLGLILGAMQAAHIGLEYFVDLGPSFRTRPACGSWEACPRAGRRR
jgi:hypothetical protein